jgi:1-deoxy-D-xylulose-5-phosphate synthase
LLDTVREPADLRALPRESLNQLADELRRETVDVVSVTGGHLGAGLGVVELTVALHRVFDTPTGKLIWDVGHQSSAQDTDRPPSAHEDAPPGGGPPVHQARGERLRHLWRGAFSTSSALRLTAHRSETRVCVIGDGAMSAGMAYEAMNNAGAMGARLIVILNDNDMSIAPPVGAMSAYLARLVSSRTYRGLRYFLKRVMRRFPKLLQVAAHRAEEYARGFWMGGTLFEEWGSIMSVDRRTTYLII